ncbi:MAG: aminotransferase class I/II-fold pyridoxal phosphate-dependent enzyme [Proteobacteria bacterium]|nr:aminotransferase class I/II-fold pyridoxal phosphate-dependent enzyme [Pseudomonadota bacterium]
MNNPLTHQPTKWSDFGTSIFSTMTQAAVKHGAVNLAQGFPNFDGPLEIKEAAIEAIRGHSWNQYAPSQGILELRSGLRNRMHLVSGTTYNADTEITVFSGATEALFCCFLGLLKPEDEVLTFSPYFDCYPAGAYAAKAKLVEIPLKAPRWTFTQADLEAKITSKSRIILVNTPHNPTGRVFSRAEMQLIADISIKHNLMVVTDEVYEELVFDEQPFTRMHTLPGMRERTVVISSTAKTFSFTGWKIGFTFAPEHLSRELRALHQFTVFCSATPLQAAMCKALELPTSYYQTLRREYTERRNFLYDGLTKLGFKIHKSEGTYFLVADYSDYADGAYSDYDDITFSHWLTEHKKVAVIPTSVFYHHGDQMRKTQRYVRFAFCKDLGTLAQALENLNV